MENTQIRLSETVMVIDAVYLNSVINDLKRYFEPLLNRSLQRADLALFTMYLAIDARMGEGSNDVQILLVYDKWSGKLGGCLPPDLKGELDGVALKGPLGGFCFMAVSSGRFVSRGELYLDLLHVVLSSAEMRKLIVVPFSEECSEEVENILKESVVESAEQRGNAKDVVFSRVEEPVTPVAYRWEISGYPLMSVLGIRSEDLQDN